MDAKHFLVWRRDRADGIRRDIFRITFSVAAVLCLCTAACAPTGEIRVMKKAHAALDEVFCVRRISGETASENHPKWGVAISPVFPASWPPDGRCVAYAHASAFVPNSNAVRIGGLWAEAHITGGKVKVVNVRDDIRNLGLQGIHLLEEDEPVAALAEKAQRKVLAAKQIKDLDEDVRRYYFWWRKRFLIADEIEPLQKPFFEWLERKGRR